MTLFDEETLKNALTQAANEFNVSATAPDRILEQAGTAGVTVKPRRIEALYVHFGRTKSIAMSLAASVLVAAVAVPLFLSETPGATFSAIGAISTGTHKKLDIQGSGFSSGQNTVINGNGQVSNTGSTASPRGTFTLGVAITSAAQGKSTASASSSSLRIEEVGTIDLTIGGRQFQTTLTQLTAFATADGGFVSSTHAHMGTKKNGTFSTGSIVLQVPERRFATLVDQVRHVGHATSVVTSANDVTGQYVDLQARISALQVSRTQYLAIMTRTNSINGILAVQSQLNSIQSQIEQLQGQLNLLNSETTYATLSVALTQSGQVLVPHSHSRNGFNKAWHDSITGFVSGFEWLLRIAGPLLFALILLAVLAMLGRFVWRASQRRRS
ncbi:MAG TPA: DUF4349 domain-containing protein [Acidimicrobiales bacterium]